MSLDKVNTPPNNCRDILRGQGARKGGSGQGSFKGGPKDEVPRFLEQRFGVWKNKQVERVKKRVSGRGKGGKVFL